MVNIENRDHRQSPAKGDQMAKGLRTNAVSSDWKYHY